MGRAKTIPVDHRGLIHLKAALDQEPLTDLQHSKVREWARMWSFEYPKTQISYRSLRAMVKQEEQNPGSVEINGYLPPLILDHRQIPADYYPEPDEVFIED